MKYLYILIGLGFLAFFSCEKSKEKVNEAIQNNANELVVTEKGDTLENGLWFYNTGGNGVSKSGNYDKGFKIGEWYYVNNSDTTRIKWSIYDKNGVKFDIPSYVKTINNIEPPILYEGDIEDGDKNTYIALLKYNLDEMNSSVHEYLSELNKYLESDTTENVISKEFKKFTFKNTEIYRINLEEGSEKRYVVVSYIFRVKDSLYDLTYKNDSKKASAASLEIFNDILYSIKCEGVDLFNYNSKQYLKEENVVFNP